MFQNLWPPLYYSIITEDTIYRIDLISPGYSMKVLDPYLKRRLSTRIGIFSIVSETLHLRWPHQGWRSLSHVYTHFATLIIITKILEIIADIRRQIPPVVHGKQFSSFWKSPIPFRRLSLQSLRYLKKRCSISSKNLGFEWFFLTLALLEFISSRSYSLNSKTTTHGQGKFGI